MEEVKMQNAIYGALLLLVSICVSAQSVKRVATVGTGTVSGHVFGITQGGDLKPARMPTIYLLYQGQADHLEENSADSQYQLVSLEALQRRLDAKKKDLDNQLIGDENLECRESLLNTDRTLLDVAQWALDNKKAKQLLTTGDDEE